MPSSTVAQLSYTNNILSLHHAAKKPKITWVSIVMKVFLLPSDLQMWLFLNVFNENTGNHIWASKWHNTASTYNITVNHHQPILLTSHGHPAWWNDKTFLCLFDPFMTKLHSGEILDDTIFVLYHAFDASGEVLKIYHGSWLLVGNGYHSHQ